MLAFRSLAFHQMLPTFCCFVALVCCADATLAEHEGKVQVLLLGDSTTIGSVCRRTEPQSADLEDVIRELLAAEKDLPPVNVINLGRDGEFIHGLLTGRYERDVAKQVGVDYIFIRYGLNDLSKRENFAENCPNDYRELIARLRKDFPTAVLVPSTTIPYLSPEKDEQLLDAIRQVGKSANLPVFDVYTRYAAELEKGSNMLNYRRFPHEKIPEPHREWTKRYLQSGSVVVMDNRLDAHFGHLEGWYSDRHPSPAGYHVIGDETAKYLAKLLRTRVAEGEKPAKPE